MCMNDRSLDSSGLREVLTLRVMGVLTHLLLRQGSSPTGKNQPKDGIRGSLRWPYPTFIEREFGNLWGYLWLSQWLRVHLALGKQNLELLDDLPHEGHSGASSIFQDILVNRKFTYCLSLTLSQVYKSEVFLHGFNTVFPKYNRYANPWKVVFCSTRKFISGYLLAWKIVLLATILESIAHSYSSLHWWLPNIVFQFKYECIPFKCCLQVD